MEKNSTILGKVKNGCKKGVWHPDSVFHRHTYRDDFWSSLVARHVPSSFVASVQKEVRHVIAQLLNVPDMETSLKTALQRSP